MKGLTSIYIVNRQPIVVNGLQKILSNYPDFKVLGSIANEQIAKDFINQHNPDVVLFGLHLNQGDSFGIIADIVKNKNLKTKVCMLFAVCDQDAFHKAMQLDIKGLLLLDVSEEELIFSLQQVLKGSLYISPSASKFLLNGKPSMDQRKLVFDKLNNLSKAELRVLVQVSHKLSNREIASELFLSTKTIENHRNKIVKRLGLKGGHHSLFAWALENRKEIRQYTNQTEVTN